MIPFRERIAELQTRVAFIAAKAITSASSDRTEINAEYRLAKRDLEAIMVDLNNAVAGSGVGPAEDCRRAIANLMRRLPNS